MQITMADLPEDVTVLSYPLPGKVRGRLLVVGPRDAENVVIFCAGFPDDSQSSFLRTARRLTSSAALECLCGVTCLPGYDRHVPWTQYPVGGYSFEEMVSALREATKTLMNHSSEASGVKLYGIFHDWGCVAGSILVNRVSSDETSPFQFQKVVLFDVLPPASTEALKKFMPPATRKKPSRLQKIYVLAVLVSYRAALAVGFALQRYISRRVAAVAYVSWAIVFAKLLKLSPTRDCDAKIIRSRTDLTLERALYMAYPYFTLFCDLLKRKHIFKTGDYRIPDCPVLYLFGVEKNVMFHGRKDVAYCESARGNKVVAVEKAGHWLYLQQPDLCDEEVRRFLSATDDKKSNL
jgi:pimeloyl-ACP methyl ester carboxylesterase